jgi:galactose-1-phosphate uridylyltransferase
MIATMSGFDGRVERSRLEIFCQPGRRVDHPILPRAARICPARGERHFEADPQKVQRIDTPREKCLFCGGKHPSVLAFVDRRMETVIPDEEGSFRVAETWLKGRDRSRIQTYYELTSQLQQYNDISASHLVRVFWNLTPADVSTEEACFVSAVHPTYHDDDLSTIWPAVPAAMVRSWQLVETWAVSKGMTAVSFINGGRRSPSGQSVACPHGQTYVVQQSPTLFKAIRAYRNAQWEGNCPICMGALDPNLLVWTDDSGAIDLVADPAPIHNWSLLVLPRRHGSLLASVDPVAFGAAIQTAVKAWRGIFTVEPALNVLIRSGEDVGHVFAELVPRTETNVLAGFELDTQDHVITVPPEFVAEKCKAAIGQPGWSGH